MPEHLNYRDDDLFNPETHHESSDVPTRPLFWAMVLLVVFAVITHLVLYFMYKTMIKGERGTGEPPRTALQRPASADVPQNQPLLQPFPKKDHQGQDVYPNRNTPVTDMEDMWRAEETILGSYSYVDRERGVVRIPIDRAKDLVLTRLPGRPGQAAMPAGSPAATPIPPAGQTMSPQQAAPQTAPDTGAVPVPATTPANTPASRPGNTPASTPGNTPAVRPANTTAATTTTGGQRP